MGKSTVKELTDYASRCIVGDMNNATNPTADAPKADIAAELAYERRDEQIWAEIIEAGRERSARLCDDDSEEG